MLKSMKMNALTLATALVVGTTFVADADAFGRRGGKGKAAGGTPPTCEQIEERLAGISERLAERLDAREWTDEQIERIEARAVRLEERLTEKLETCTSEDDAEAEAEG